MQAMGSYSSLWLFALVIIFLYAILPQYTAFVKRIFIFFMKTAYKIIAIEFVQMLVIFSVGADTMAAV